MDFKRYLEIIQSPRFQQSFAIFVLQILSHYNVLDAFVINAISILLGVSVTIATVDRASEKIGK